MVVSARAKDFDVILVHKLDCFARNDYDFVIYEKELADLGIRLESVSEPGDDSTPSGYISRRIMQVISSWYSKNLAVEVKKGMQRKVEIGGWPKPAPMGYINKRDGNKAWIEVDPWYAPLITKAFNEMATGKWTLDEWADQAYSSGYKAKEGNPIRKQTWSKIFYNRFYLGETWLKEGDPPVRGNHEPLVSEDVFVEVQEMLKEHDKHKQHTQRHKYLLKGLAYSLDANCPCWAETNPKKKISYYRSCTKVNGSQVYYNTRDIDSQLLHIIENLAITNGAQRELREELENWFHDEEKGNEELKQAEARLAKLRKDGEKFATTNAGRTALS